MTNRVIVLAMLKLKDCFSEQWQRTKLVSLYACFDLFFTLPLPSPTAFANALTLPFTTPLLPPFFSPFSCISSFSSPESLVPVSNLTFLAAFSFLLCSFCRASNCTRSQTCFPTIRLEILDAMPTVTEDTGVQFTAEPGIRMSQQSMTILVYN